MPESALQLEQIIVASNRNVARLIDDARELFEGDRFPSAYALAVLAQEEAAKVYLLDLVRLGDVPWTEGVRRAVRDHRCKQLLAEVLDYMDSELEAILERAHLRLPDPPDLLRVPDRILSILEIFRYEKVGAFVDGHPPFWMDDPRYDQEALRIAEGRDDALKQDAIYVRVGRNGQLATRPEHAISREMAEKALERAKRLGGAVGGIEKGGPALWNYDEVRKVFRILFTDPKVLKEQGLIDEPAPEA